VWAPPEDDTVTPGATSTVFDEDPVSVSFVGVVAVDEPSVVPDCGVEVEVASWAGVESVADEAPPVLVALAPCPFADGESLDESLDDPVDESVVAHAKPAGVAMADPTPNATASAPIRPT
jgi:hypothetical protein